MVYYIYKDVPSFRKEDLMEVRKMNVIFTKGGSGSVTTKLSVPKTWLDKMGVTQEEREVFICFDGQRIIIDKER